MKMNFDYTNLNYHRNGICGVGFWSAIFTNPFQDAQGRFLITWVTKEGPNGGQSVDEEQTRVVSLDEPDLNWRGEHFGKPIDRHMRRTGAYDKYFGR